jgi:hypothetical protein
MPSDGERTPLTERLLLAFSAVTRWAGQEFATNPAADQPGQPHRSRRPRRRGGCANPITLFKIVVFLLVIVACPLFLLPLMLVRLAGVGRTGLRWGAAVDTRSGDQARWGHGALQPPAVADAIAAGAEDISLHDPAFQISALTGWAVAATALICESLVSGEATPARTFMANGLYRTHLALLELRQRADVSCDGSWRAADAAVAAATRSPLVDEVRVRVTCQGWRWERHQPTGLTLRGGPDSGIWSEDLTFARAADAVTPAGGGLPARRCPSCGADLDLDAGGACRYCGGIVTAGRRDWVLVSWQREPW